MVHRKRSLPEDLSFTRRLAASARLLGIRLLDHLILGNAGRWVSLKRCGGWDDGGER
ncbi:MAG: JAB domain-containing protein [Thermoanaerobaculia bacterium]